MIVLTKSQILEGVKYTEDFPVDELGGAVRIRALSDGELTKVETDYLMKLAAVGIRPENLSAKLIKTCPNCGAPINPREDSTMEQTVVITQSMKERDWAMVALALSVGEEKWTPEEVSGLVEKDSIISKIGARVEEISRGRQGQAESFRKSEGGAGVEETAQPGISAE